MPKTLMTRSSTELHLSWTPWANFAKPQPSFQDVMKELAKKVDVQAGLVEAMKLVGEGVSPRRIFRRSCGTITR